MAKLVKSYSTILAVIAIALLVAGGLAIASNMGFKLLYLLYTTGASAKTGTNWVSLPMNFPFANASDLKTDVGATCTQVSRHIRSTDALQTYTGKAGSPNFPIEKGHAYIIKVNADTNYVIVGSHDPSFGILLNTTGASAKTGTNWISVPYHTTASNASELKSDVGSTCTQVSRHIRSSDALQTYTGKAGSPNFPITPGEGYIIKVNADTTWTPSHY
ncbi:MAG: hypothetical protein AB1297_05495 [bacterium]